MTVSGKKTKGRQEIFVAICNGYKIVRVRREGWVDWYRAYNSNDQIKCDFFRSLEHLKRVLRNGK